MRGSEHNNVIFLISIFDIGIFKHVPSFFAAFHPFYLPALTADLAGSCVDHMVAQV